MNRRPGLIRVWTVLALLLCGMGFAVEASAAHGDPLVFFTVVPPCRVFDSREIPPQFIGDGPALSGGVSRFIPIIGSNGNCNIPADAEVVTLNITVTQPTTGGRLFVGAGGSNLPSEAMEKINFTPGSTRANNATVSLASGGIEAEAEMGGTVHLIVDITGYYAHGGAVNDTATVQEDAAATAIDVLANDSNPASTITAVTQPANGTVVITGGGTGLTYQPNADYCNTPPGTTLDTFTYTTSPGSFTATVSVTVNCVDDDPVAVDDSATVAEDAAATAIDVLANDTDVDGGPISVTSVTQPTNGTVVITGGGTGLTYQPKADYCNNPPGTTPDTFTYTLTPGGDTATVSVTVNCNDGSPVANNDTATVLEDAAATPIDVLANDTDEESDPFTVTSVTQPANGTVVITGGGTGLTYQPNANYCNTPPGTTLDTFTYTLAPGGSTATVTVTVTCVDDDPVAVDDAATVTEDDPATAIDVLANDTDVDNGPISITSVTQPANGTVVITGGGTGLTYQPNADYCTSGTPDTFTYTLTPGGDTATVSVTVTCLEGNPVANDDSATVAEDSGATAINVLANDTDEESDPFTISAVTQPANGTVVITGGGTGLTYQPNANYCNTPPGTTLDTFTYTLTPGGDSATVTVTVTCVDDNPVAVDDSATVLEDAAATPIDVLANDSDGENDAFTITSVTQPANGAVVITGGGTGLTYQPNANYCNSQVGGTPDTFTYTLTPGGDTATVSMTVTCVEDNPTAVDDAATVAEDSGANAINVLANDTDPDGGANTISAVTQPANGTVVITGGGTGLTYQPNANFCTTGTPDTFTYTLSPGGSTATVSVTVTCVDDNPAAVNDSATVLEDAAATPIDVLANDTDADGGPISITSVTQPTNGAVVITGGGTGLTYQPNANYCNSISGTPDTFTYTLTPGGSTATVSMTVTCVEDNPTAVNDSATVLEDAAATPIDVLANDTDPDGGTNTVASVTQPANGAVVITGGGTGLSYQPNANYCNSQVGGTPDTFTYTLTPGGSVATVSVTVTCVDDNPVAVADAATLLEDAAATPIDVLANDTDIDGGPKSVAAISPAAGNGTVLITGGGTGVTYQPNPNFCGSDSFGYSLSPGGSSTTVSVTVTCVNDAPVLVDNTLEYTILGNTQLRVGDTTPGTGLFHMRDNQDVKEKTLPSDVDGPGPLDVEVVSGPANGQVTMNADGTFTYLPNAGFEGTDVINFRVGDNGSPEAFANGTISITVSEMVWYVHDVVTADNPAASDTGQSTNAFEVLADAVSAAKIDPGDDDYIFVFAGNTAVTPHAGGFKLDATGTKLHGEAIGLIVPEFGVSPLIPAGTRPRIVLNTNATGGEDNGVTVEAAVATLAGMQIRGFNITGFDNAIDVTATGGNSLTLTVSDNTLTSSVAEGIDVNANGTGVVTVDVQGNTLTGATNGFDARTGAAGQLRVNLSNHTDITAGANAVHIDGAFAGSLATITGFSNNSVHANTGGTGVFVNAATFDSNVAAGIQAVNANNLRVGISGNGTGGAGVVMTNVQGALTFDDLDIFADNGAGLRVSGTGSGMTFTVPPSVAIIDANGGPAVDVTATALTLPLQTLESTNSPSTGVALNSITGTFSAGSGSSISSIGAAGTAFQVGSSNATVSYAGTITTTQGTGVSLTSNTGSTIGFTGTLTLSTATNPAFTATGRGTVTATDTASVLTTTTATALNVANTTIGAGGLRFRSVSAGTAASGPLNGIVLNSTGASGGLTVSGNGNTTLGGDNSGGTIQRTTGDAISLTNTRNVSMTNLRIQNIGTGSGDGAQGIQAVNLAGSNFFRYGTITGMGQGGGADRNGIDIRNTNTDMTLFSVENSSFSNSDSGTSFILAFAQGTSSMRLDVKDSDFSDLVALAVQSSAGNTEDAAHTMTTNITGNTFRNASPADGQGGVAVTIGEQVATHNFTISNNTFIDLIKGIAGGNSEILLAQTTGGNLNGTIANNILGNATAGNGDRRGIGVIAEPDVTANGELGSVDIIIEGNTIDRLPNREAIFVDLREDTQSSELIIRNNQIGLLPGFLGLVGGDLTKVGAQREAIDIQTRGEVSRTLNLLLSGNNVRANTSVNVVNLEVNIDNATPGNLTMHATVTGNSFKNDDPAGSAELIARPRDAGAVTTLCLDLTGNTFDGGAGQVDLNETGVLNVEQASQAALATANGIPSGNVLITGGAPSFGVACQAPPS
jgi:hypothetical protein